jgi:uncharacterized membrane protein
MKRNESKLDRVIRALLGTVLIVGGLFVGGTVAVVMYALAGVLIITAAVGFCPLYALLKLDTCKAAGECQ